MEKPNIVFIISDQHNPYVAGYAGDPYIDTPNLDELAKNGVCFNNCYCNSPLCVPSRSSMLSGKLPSKTLVTNNMQCLRSDEPTFVSSLAIAGYETVLAGRMHFVGYDQRHGYEKRLVGDVCPTFPRFSRPEKLYGVLKGTPAPNYVSIDKSGAGKSAMTYFDREVTDAACRFLESRTDGRPLFLTVGYANPHNPFVAPRELYDKYYSLLPVQEPLSDHEFGALHPAIQKFIELRGVRGISKEELRRVRAAYYANVEYMDRLIGEVRACVEKRLGPDTVVIYVSDHGEGAGKHGLFWKSNFFESSARVPMIISAPQYRRFSGETNDTLISLVDLAPTLIEWAGGPSLPDADGRSLVPVIEHDESEPERTVISQLIDVKGDQPSAMIRKGRYKLIHHCTYEFPQLFDLEKDPDEENDLGSDPEYKNVISELRKELSLYWDDKKALRELQIRKYNLVLFYKWSAAANPDCPDEWWCPSEDNFFSRV